MEFSSIEDCVNAIEQSFLKGMEQSAKAIALAFTAAVGNNIPIAAIDGGTLRDSLKIEFDHKGDDLIVNFTWATPYAQRQYYQHKSKSEWDIKTYEQNRPYFRDIIVKSIMDNL